MSSAGLLVVGFVIYKRMTGASSMVTEVRNRRLALEAQQELLRRAAAQVEGN